MSASGICWCGRPSRAGGRYCLACHARHTREWRKSHPMDAEARRRSNARSYAHVYVKRGKIKREPCKCCGSENSQIHHPDYGKPVDVIWLCRPCHLDLHRGRVIPGVPPVF